MAKDERDPPIEPQNFLAGVTVVDIGDVRVARGLSRRHHSSCPHRRLTYDNRERRIWCRDCERDVEGFDAFIILAEGYDRALKSVAAREKAITEVEQFKMRSIAAKKMDEAWRAKTTVPACPHCGNGLFPESFKNGVPTLGKEYAAARIAKSQKR